MSNPHSLHLVALRSLLICLSLAGVVLASGCSRSEAQGGPPMGPPVSVAPTVQRMSQAIDEFTGRLEATETVDVRSRVGGTLEAVLNEVPRLESNYTFKQVIP